MSEARYSLSVTRQDPNPAYNEAEAREIERRNMSGYSNSSYMSPEISRQVLTVDLTEAEWIAVKRAVLEVKC